MHTSSRWAFALNVPLGLSFNPSVEPLFPSSLPLSCWHYYRTRSTHMGWITDLNVTAVITMQHFQICGCEGREERKTWAFWRHFERAASHWNTPFPCCVTFWLFSCLVYKRLIGQGRKLLLLVRRAGNKTEKNDSDVMKTLFTSPLPEGLL